MPKLTETELLARDAARDLDAELQVSLKQLKSGNVGRVFVKAEGGFIESEVAKVRFRTRLSQSKFAGLLGVSVRTLQDWEQGRRKPSGAALTLLKVAAKHPEVLLDVA